MTDTNGSAPVQFEYITDWQMLDPADGQAISDFWKREGALGDDGAIKARLPQVVAHARDANGVVAVCTAVPMTPPAFGQPVYYFRSFVGKNWRTTTVFKQLFKRAQAALENYARDHYFPCIGILLELEGVRFKEKGRVPIWPHGLIYIGKSARGLESRIYYFKGAKLKPLK